MKKFVLKTRILAVCSGPPITHFLSAVDMKSKNFDQVFFLIQANTTCRQKIKTAKLLHKYFVLNILNLDYVSIQLLSK